MANYLTLSAKMLQSFFKDFYLFIFREGGREEEGDQHQYERHIINCLLHYPTEGGVFLIGSDHLIQHMMTN